MKIKALLIGKMRILPILIGVILLSQIIGYSASQSTPTSLTSLTSGFCSGLLSPSTGVTSANLNNLVGISFLIILVMLLLLGAVYGIGYAIQYEKLINFSKIELGEIILTVLIISVFLGSSFGINSLYSSGNRFMTACTYLSASSLATIPGILIVYLVSTLTNLITNLKLGANAAVMIPIGVVGVGLKVGISFTPFAGLSLLLTPIKFVMSLFTITLVLDLAVILFIVLIYSLFPIFLFAGIVLRTIPWTRAAGGAFLGIFVGFYVFFPVVLTLMLGVGNTTNVAPPSVQPPNMHASPTSAISQVSSEVSGIFGQSANSGILQWFADKIAAPSVYSFFSVIISLILSFDFAETVGDYLGAPSFTGANVLGKLI